jgi:hypothetical protein
MYTKLKNIKIYVIFKDNDADFQKQVATTSQLSGGMGIHANLQKAIAESMSQSVPLQKILSEEANELEAATALSLGGTVKSQSSNITTDNP